MDLFALGNIGAIERGCAVFVRVAMKECNHACSLNDLLTLFFSVPYQDRGRWYPPTIVKAANVAMVEHSVDGEGTGEEGSACGQDGRETSPRVSCL